MAVYIRIQTDNYNMHTYTYIYMHTHKHTQYSLCFLLCSDCGCVHCWSNSQTTVAALFMPSLLCDRYEGSPLCDQKTFLSSLSHSEPVWSGVPIQEEPRIQKKKKKACHFCPQLLFNVLCLSHSSVVLVWCFLCSTSFSSFITDILCVFFPSK